MKTFTRRDNARRAAVKAGIKKELIKITVHKTPNEIRFGYAELKQPSLARTKPVRPQCAKGKSKVRERNGIKRPVGNGRCAAVWDFLDNHSGCTAKQIREQAASNGWNVNNTLCELYRWRRFNRA